MMRFCTSRSLMTRITSTRSPTTAETRSVELTRGLGHRHDAGLIRDLGQQLRPSAQLTGTAVGIGPAFSAVTAPSSTGPTCSRLSTKNDSPVRWHSSAEVWVKPETPVLQFGHDVTNGCGTDREAALALQFLEATGWPSRMCISTSVFKSDDARGERASNGRVSGSGCCLF